MSRFNRRNGSGGGTQEAPPKNKPIYSRKHWTGRGTIETAVFEKVMNEGKQNEFVDYFVTVKKTFKNDKDEYEETSAFDPHEMLVMIEASRDLYEFVEKERKRE